MSQMPFSTPALQPIPQQRIVEKLDEHMSRRDYAAVERHLLYWLEEALSAGDRRGELTVRNELVGHFRKTGDGKRALEHAQAAIDLVGDLGFQNTISAGTTYVNAATAYQAFGESAHALELFQKAAEVYGASPHADPKLLGGLYNNMALACVALERFDQADELYEAALATMAHVEHGELEQAITYLNMADAAMARSHALAAASGDATEPDPACEEQVERYLDTAAALLDTPTVPRDGYYAFVCEKCAPTFAYHGYFLVDADLRKRAEAIYARA